MCHTNCIHTEDCELEGTGYNCDLKNDTFESMCDTCRPIAEEMFHAAETNQD